MRRRGVTKRRDPATIAGLTVAGYRLQPLLKDFHKSGRDFTRAILFRSGLLMRGSTAKLPPFPAAEAGTEEVRRVDGARRAHAARPRGAADSDTRARYFGFGGGVN